MATQFRNRYPNGSLISELLAIDHGKFIVRVLLQVDDIILATGLAAAETVELAEDQARQRALDILGSESVISPTQATTSTAPHLPISASPIVEPVTPPSEALTPSESSEHETDIPASSSEDWLSATYLTSEKGKKGKQQSKKDSSAKGRTASLPTFALNDSEISDPESSLSNETATHPPSTTASARNKGSKDFSDDIAKTDIQLQRLGWTAEQGAAHLQKTYGKRSRRLLTEEELLDFLNYLESLDAPISSDDI